jgi:hypothetical protein
MLMLAAPRTAVPVETLCSQDAMPSLLSAAVACVLLWLSGWRGSSAALLAHSGAGAAAGGGDS